MRDEAPCINQTCIAGICQGQCEFGAKRCSANYPQICNASGAWENNGPACGTCIECDCVTKACNADPVQTSLCIQPTTIATGRFHTCARFPSETIKCWGNNSFGQLGLGDTNARGNESNEMGPNLPTVDLGAGATATEIHAGHSHTCALLSSGRVKCWGRSVYGQLGQSDTVTRGDESKDMGDGLVPVEL